MSLADDVCDGVASVLSSNASFTTLWNFHAEHAEQFGEIAESNQNRALVRLIGKDTAPKYETSARTAFNLEVLIDVWDRADADTNVGALADALQETLGGVGDVLYAAISDGGSNLLDGIVENEITSLVWERDDPDAPTEAETKSRRVTMNLRVTCWHVVPLN